MIACIKESYSTSMFPTNNQHNIKIHLCIKIPSDISKIYEYIFLIPKS